MNEKLVEGIEKILDKSAFLHDDYGVFYINQYDFKAVATAIAEYFQEYARELVPEEYIYDGKFLREILEEEYLQNKKSISEIAKMIGKSYNFVRNRLKEFKIPIRSKAEASFKGENFNLKLTQRAKEFIEGGLLGDACLRKYRGGRNAQLEYSSKFKRYLEWIKMELEKEGIEFSRIRYSGGGFRLSSKAYPCLTELWLKWYKNHKKIIPTDFRFTSISLRQLYLDDGCLAFSKKGKKGKPHIILSVQNFEEKEIEFLVLKLKEIGIQAKRKKDNTIYISCKSLDTFFSYIGDCPINVYTYKWYCREEMLRRIEAKPIKAKEDNGE